MRVTKFLMVLALIMCSTVAFSATKYVKWDSPTDGPGNDLDHAYHTIAQAITASSTGDTVYVYGQHSYAEAVALNKGITLEGVNSATIDNSAVGGYGITISVANVTLKNFKIIGGHQAAIVVSSSGNGAYIKGCQIDVYTYGIGIYVGYNAMFTDGARIENNIISGGSWKSTGFFGGIVNYGGSTMIMSNLIKDGARGIMLAGSGIPFVYNNTIVGNNNVALGSNPPVTKGGGIYVTGGLNQTCMPYLENNIFANNRADYGGAYYFDALAGGAFTDISNSTFYGNTSNISGYVYYPLQSTWPTIGYDGNNEDDPLFLTGGNYRLQSTSTCIGSGNNTYDGGACNWTDLVGLPRRIGDVVDRGCYEGASAIDAAKTVGNYTELRGKVITGNFGDRFYIEETNRVIGTKVIANVTANPGDLAIVDGQYVNSENEISLQANNVVIATGSSSNIPCALGMCNRSIGGLNIGLLIRTWGKITAVNSGVYTVDDGSGVDTQVVWPGTAYSVNDYIAVTGVSCYGCVRATSVDYITTIEEQLLMSVSPNQSQSLRRSLASLSSSNTRYEALTRWREFLQSNLDELAKHEALTASQQSWKELMEMLLTKANEQLSGITR